MITIWNQKEVFIGNPSQELLTITDLLSKNKIRYKCRVFSDKSVHFLNTKGPLFDISSQNNNNSKIYYVYVHSKDYDHALSVLRND